jgi:LuxR family maltose regulon positive regulatory protein
LLSIGESVRFLEKQISNHTFSHGKIYQLAKDSGGWVTGLNLAATILRTNQRIEIPPLLGEHEVMQGYLVDNVLAMQPHEIQEFLVKTSFLGELNADLCMRVTGNPNSAQILEYIWEHQLFISKLDSDQDIYQYHSLFSQALQAQLFARYPLDASQLLRVAANWNKQNGYYNEAVAQYIADQQWDKAIAVIEEVSLDILKNKGEDSLLLRWFMLLPNGLLKNRIDLFLLYALLVKVSLSPEYVSANLKIILDDLASWDVGVREKKLISEFIEDLENSVEIDESYSKWDEYIQHAEYKETIQLVSAYYNYAFITNDPSKILNILNQARRQNNKFIYILISANYANNLMQNNRLSQTKKHVEQLMDSLYLTGRIYPAPVAILYSQLAEIYFERNQLNDALFAIRKNKEIDQNPASTNNLVYRNLLAAKIYIALNDFERGQVAIDRATLHFFHRKPTLFAEASIRAQQAALFLQKGEIDLAEQYILETDEPDFNFDLAVIKAWLLLYKGEFSQLLIVLESGLVEKATVLPTQSRTELEVLLPFTLYKLDKVFEAKKRMLQLLRGYAKEQIYHPFFKIGEEILPLLKNIFHTVKISKQVRVYIIKIFQGLGSVSDIHQWSKKEDSQAKMMNITNREMEILQEVAQGLSNQEIAWQLSISDNTVKTHVNNIYRKFSVSSRVQAVQMAQEMKII